MRLKGKRGPNFISYYRKSLNRPMKIMFKSKIKSLLP